MLSPSLLIVLAIILFVVAGLALYLLQKIGAQDHKLQSMMGVVTTLAEEVHGLRRFLSASPPLAAGGGAGAGKEETQNTCVPLGGCAAWPSLIPVSDDGEDEDEVDDYEDNEEDEDDDDMEDDDMEDEDDEDEDDEDDEDEDMEDDDDMEDQDVAAQIKSIHIGDSIHTAVDTDGTYGFRVAEVTVDPVDLTVEDIPEEEGEGEGEAETTTVTDSGNATANDSHILSSFDLNDPSLFRSVSVDIPSLSAVASEGNEVDMDLKKLSVTKLRSLVEEKGLVQDASRWKKPELLKILGSSE
jgi:hypothetical protein